MLKVDLFFLYAVIWSVGAILDEPSQGAFSIFLRELIKKVHQIGDKTFKIEPSCMIPEMSGTRVHDFFIDTLRWTHWKERVPKSFSDEAVSYTHL